MMQQITFLFWTELNWYIYIAVSVENTKKGYAKEMKALGTPST